MISSPTHLDPIVLPLISGETALDVGCGYGRWGNLIQSNFWEAGPAAPPPINGCDAFKNNVALCRNHACYRNVWHHLLPNRFPASGMRFWRTRSSSICLRNDFEAHLSHTARAEFRDRGYRIVGAGFGNPESLVTRTLWKINRHTTEWFQ
ncbi:MAG: hypothetical protein H7Z16_19665 [Pyrinomonadaceae bacterium]|nr:hypothetical protein [Pyrinomonadaceae bacterium]